MGGLNGDLDGAANCRVYTITKRMYSMATPRGHRFGGDWTTAKLDVLARYLAAYTTALKDRPSKARPFRKAYIDAFAGTGYRETRHEEGTHPELLLFPDLAEQDPQDLLDGSARLALQTAPRFDKYIFIEQSAARCAALEGLKAEFPNLAADVRVERGDANERIREICAANWREHRAVLFLDPYGMQVEWQTLDAVAKTRAIDLWVLFPFGIGVNRLLTTSGDIPEAWRHRLTSLLGTDAWDREFYHVERSENLFGEAEERRVKVKMDAIGRYFVERLKTIFPGVAENPGVLRNSSNSPLYLLCFAASNRRGAPIALRIAEHLLKELR
jgi:three-Cys-motif partner protein